ncbi:hypothetical protein Syun_000878 [Stephania yunnanensis]|uniref:Uncharacterized protein n=1 Tax=Stephania yunnanensis TaxID=152371 RepID=A0AAP0LDW3_9MAGN
MPLSLQMALGVIHSSTENPTSDTKGKAKALGVLYTGMTKKKIIAKATGGKKEVAGRGKKESTGPSSDPKGKSKVVGVPPVTSKLEKGVATTCVATTTLPQCSSARLKWVKASKVPSKTIDTPVYKFGEEEEDTPVQEGEKITDDEEDFDEEDSDYDSDDEAVDKGMAE